MEKKGILDIIKKITFGKAKIIVFVIIILIVILGLFLILFNKNAIIKINIKSSLDKIVEKNNLETVTFTYNTIAKKCKNEEKCDKNSNNINDFEFVASCTGKVTAGIDFEKVEIDVDKKNKKITITIPETSMTSETNVQPPKILNGANLPASKTADAIKLCEETTKEKAASDVNVNSIAKEQAKIVLEQFYSQWINAYDSSYVIEVK